MQPGGQPTFTLKRIMAMQGGAATTAQQSAPTAYGDVEMEDVSAPTNVATNHSQSRQQPSFSAAAKPFVPPSAAVPTTVTMAPQAAPLTPATPVTTVKRPPPHRALKSQPPRVAPLTITKPDLSATPAHNEHSAAYSPKRRLGPHAKLGPHAQKASGTLPATSIDSVSSLQTQPQHLSTAQATTPVSTAPGAWVDVQQLKSESEPWVDVQEQQVDMKTASTENTEAESNQSMATPVSVDQELSSAYAKPAQQASEAETMVEHAFVPKIAPSALEKQPLASIAKPDQMSDNTTIQRFGRNEWLPLLLDMKDTAKGRDLIRAFADHIRAGVDVDKTASLTSGTEQELWIEFAGGERLAATVARDTTVSHVVKEFAKMTHIDESEVHIMLKVGNHDHGN